MAGNLLIHHGEPDYARAVPKSLPMPDMDFETYSEAGYLWNDEAQKWDSIVKSAPHGLGAVGASVYSEHPSTEVLSLAWDLKDGLGPRLWIPGMPPPQELFDYLASMEPIEAHNSSFEWYIWTNVCAARMGWPPLPYYLLRDSMAKAAAFSVPTALDKLSKVLGTFPKDPDGKRLLQKFSKPRKPTKKDPRRRIRPEEDPEDADKLYKYNIDDIKAEADASEAMPDLLPSELELWLLDQCINFRGVHIDRKAMEDCISIVNQATERGTAELVALTNGTVQSVGEITKLSGWLGAMGVHMLNMQAETIETTLEKWAFDDQPNYNAARRALQIRSSLGAASVKKLYAMDRRLSRDGRLRDLFAFCGADRTGRFAGRGPQPQNLPSSGPSVRRCTCDKYYGESYAACPWCGADHSQSQVVEWSFHAVEDALEIIATRSLETVERYFEDAIEVVSACLRGLFTAAPGCDLISSDYSAIEAVVLAALAGEEWRLEVFRTHGKIYEMSASDISGIPFEDFLKHKATTGEHHPLRKKIGKVAELASGFGGWIGAWNNFGADKHFDSEAAIKEAILAWRAKSPNIVEFWGGQVRKDPHRWEWWHDLHGVEGAVVKALQTPGSVQEIRGIKYYQEGDVLYCELLSGRKLCYQSPRLTPMICSRSKLSILQITYMGRDTYTRQWTRLETYSGKLVENVVQATARDILTDALKRTERAGYSTVLHVHDEIAAEVLSGTGSVEEFERIMSIMPDWCSDWPIRAAGGWRGKRYRKD